MQESIPGVLFEYERISDTIMDFGLGVSLKLVADLGFKEKDSDNKLRVYNEYRYRTNKYDNVDYAVSVNRKIRYYLKIEYPNIQNQQEESMFKKNSIMIYPYSILGLRNVVNEFDKILLDPYVVRKDGSVSINPIKAKTMVSNPSPGSIISFSHDICDLDDGSFDYGVKILFNDDYEIKVRSLVTWKAFVYYINSCDLYLWGSQLVAPYMSRLVGNAVSDVSCGQYHTTAPYSGTLETTYEPDPENIKEANNLLKKTSSSNQNGFRKKSKGFFDS